MQLIRRVNSAINNARGAVVTIGNFDGMHLGHQYILSNVIAKAKHKKLIASVICFEPQPKEFFMKAQASTRVMPFRDKIKAFAKQGINQVLCLRFSQYLANLSAQSFIDEILVGGLNAKIIIIGDDFRFGAKRQGDFTFLQQQGLAKGFEVISMSSLLKDELRISSSYVRQLLQQGAFAQANRYLGHAYSISGRIHHGDQNGRKIGFPTINIPIAVKLVISGVYVVKVHIAGDIHMGVANIGIRPTVDGKVRLLETHIFNFNHDLYGQYVTIEFLHFIRSEKKFNSIDDLKAQIQQDKEVALQWAQQNTKNQQVMN